MSSKDYSIYIRDKKTQVSQTVHNNISSVKFRSPVTNFNYFPLYKSVEIIPKKTLAIRVSPTNFNFFTIVDGTITNPPYSGVYDGVDNIYITTKLNVNPSPGIVKYSISTNVLSTFFTNTSSVQNLDVIAYDNVNNCLYVASSTNGTLYTISNLSTTPTASLLTSVNFPNELAFDGSNTLYVTDIQNHVIYQVNVTTKIATVYAGVYGSVGSVDGDRTTIARFRQPTGIICDGTSAVYVSEGGNHLIRKIVGTTVSTIAGTNGISGFVNGVGTSASFNNPRGLSIDTVNKILYVTDRGNYSYRSIDLTTRSVTTVAGSGVTGNTPSITGGNALEANFGNNIADCIYVFPNLYIPDTQYKSLHKVKLY